MFAKSISFTEPTTAHRLFIETMRRYFPRASYAFLFPLPALFCPALFAQTPNCAHTVTVDNHKICVELARTQQEQMRGLQGRKHLADNEGMLFIFKPAREVCMWMQNVPIDLDVGFFSSDGKLQTRASMKAQTETLHCSAGPVSFALEMRGGWFADHDVAPGAALNFQNASQ